MSKFRVGMKVVLLHCCDPIMNQWFEGMESTIIGPAPEAGYWQVDAKPGAFYFDHPVNPDAKIYYKECHMKPLYDGDTPVSWDECAWQPEKVYVYNIPKESQNG